VIPANKEEKKSILVNTVNKPMYDAFALSGEKNNGFYLPDWVPKEEWYAYIEIRIKAKFPVTDHAKKLLLRKLEKLRGEGIDPAEAINAACMKPWQSFYKPTERTQDGQRREPFHFNPDTDS
jgi:hypothetical protein